MASIVGIFLRNAKELKGLPAFNNLKRDIYALIVVSEYSRLLSVSWILFINLLILIGVDILLAGAKTGWDFSLFMDHLGEQNRIDVLGMLQYPNTMKENTISTILLGFVTYIVSTVRKV
jgi:hypothetical protein